MGNSGSSEHTGKDGEHEGGGGVDRKGKLKAGGGGGGAAAAAGGASDGKRREGEAVAKKLSGRRAAAPGASGADIRHAISLYDGETLPEDFAEVGRQLFCRCGGHTAV